jgi:hypothetical protein
MWSDILVRRRAKWCQGRVGQECPTHTVSALPSALHVKFRYGTFYNCPVERKGISVTGGACCMLA